MEESYSQLAEELEGGHVAVAKFQADVDRDFAQDNFQLKSFPTIVMLPKGGSGKQVQTAEACSRSTLLSNSHVELLCVCRMPSQAECHHDLRPLCGMMWGFRRFSRHTLT